MPVSLTTQTIAEEFDRKGAFRAITDWVNDGTISKAEATSFYSQTFKVFQEKVKEAQIELVRLNAVLARIEGICRTGAQTRPGAILNGRPPEVERLATEIGTLDNWVISLYESNISMVYWGAPDLARRKPNELANSMEALRQKRLANLKLNLKDPSLFKIN